MGFFLFFPPLAQCFNFLFFLYFCCFRPIKILKMAPFAPPCFLFFFSFSVRVEPRQFELGPRSWFFLGTVLMSNTFTIRADMNMISDDGFPSIGASSFPSDSGYPFPATHSCEIDQDTWENSPAHYVQLKEIKRGCTGLRYGLDQSVLFTSAIRTRTRDGEMSRPPFSISWAPIKAERQFKSTGDVGFTSDWRPKFPPPGVSRFSLEIFSISVA